MPTFRFIDLPTVADMMGISRAQVIQYIEEGALKPFQGTGQAAVFRTRDVEALITRRGVEAAAAAPSRPDPVAAADSAALEAAARRRTETIRRDPVKKVGTRLTQDMRWGEITDADLAAWFDALDRRSYPIVRHAARQALARLNDILALTGGAGETAADRDLAASGRAVTAQDLRAPSRAESRDG